MIHKNKNKIIKKQKPRIFKNNKKIDLKCPAGIKINI